MRSLFCTLAVVGALALSGCYKVTIVPSGGPKVMSEPDYSRSSPFYVFGLIGEEHVDVSQVCSSEPQQMQTQHTFLDGLLGTVTFGIYTPATASIWCR